MEALEAIFPARDCTLLMAIVALPLIGAFVNGVFGKRLGREAVTLMGLVVIAASFCASVTAFFLLREQQERSHDEAARLAFHAWKWLSLSPQGELTSLSQGGHGMPIAVDITFSADALSGTMALIVTGIGFLIHLYSSEYMKEDPGFTRFFAYLNLFIFSMLVLILGDSLPVLFVGWEGVGLCSYLLIGFWFTDGKNAAAGKKAFITNRIGDFGLLVAMALLVRYTGSLSWSGIAANAGELLRPMTIWHIPALEDAGGVLGAIGAPRTVSVATLVGLSLFLGCAGKSAQFPLYVWLPDAMAGPTPVSALIHAATMVTAGVYLVCRLSPVFVLSPAALFVVAVTGAFTALLAATIALVQNDIKKVLAYSTVSQLGYMFIGVGVGAFTAGFFHVITHAFFKACLFLGAGSVIHAMHAKIHDTDASQDVRNMGGLRKYMPITHATFLVSCLAIAGFPFTSGFYSKDEILHKAFTATVHSPSGQLRTPQGSVDYFAWPEWTGTLLLTAGILGATMTAFYMFRLYFLTFWGDFKGWKAVAGYVEPAHAHAGHAKDDHGHGHDDHGHGHDDHAHHAHDPSAPGPEPHESPLPMYLPLVVLGFLALVAGVVWTHPLEHWLEPVFKPVEHSLSFAEGGGIVQWLAMGSCFVGIGLAYFIYEMNRGGPAAILAFKLPKLHKLLLDKWRVDEFYEEFVIGTIDFVADVCVWVDRWVVDGVIARLSAWIVAVAGHLLRLLQTGRVQAYAAVMVIGTAGLGWFFTMPQARAVIAEDAASGRFTVNAAPGLGYAYRWDANADGKPDAEEFSDKRSVELTLRAGESREVKLEVKNAFGRTSEKVITITREKPEDMGALLDVGSPQRVAGVTGEVAR